MPIFELQNETRAKTKKPSMYKVILYNDDFTPFEFVEYVLLTYFKKEGADVMRIAQEAHNTGRALVGVYTRDVATSRCNTALSFAKQQGFVYLKIEAKPEED